MRVIDLPTFWTILLDVAAWFAIHLGVVAATTSIAIERFDPRSRMFRAWGWERGGAFYERWFDVRKWKQRLPDAAGVLGARGFSKRRLASTDSAYLALFSRETCRAELTHVLTMVWAPFFFLWNPVWVGWLMIVYATVENLPLIMAQRYNRARIERILARRASRQIGSRQADDRG